MPAGNPKAAAKRGMFALTVVTAVEGRDIRRDQLPFPSAEGRVPPHDGLVQPREGDPDCRFVGEGALHIGVRMDGKKAMALLLTTGPRGGGWACTHSRP